MGFLNKLIIALLIILLLGIGVLYTSYQNYKTIKEQNQEIEILKQVTPIDHPLLSYEFDSWNEDTEGNYEFTGYVWNYGNEEAKNVELTCYIKDANKKVVSKKIENVGSAASSAWTMKVVEIAKDNTNSGEHATGVCYYSGSANGFNLMQNIKAYKDIIV